MRSFDRSEFERRVFHAVKKLHMFQLLLSFHSPSVSACESLIMCWSVEGRLELLKELRDRVIDYREQKILVWFAICELRFAKRINYLSPVTDTFASTVPSFWRYLDVKFLKRTSADFKRRRNACL